MSSVLKYFAIAGGKVLFAIVFVGWEMFICFL